MRTYGKIIHEWIISRTCAQPYNNCLIAPACMYTCALWDIWCKTLEYHSKVQYYYSNVLHQISHNAQVYMHAGAIRQLLYGCAHVREIIHSLKFMYYLPVHTHKPYNNLHIKRMGICTIATSTNSNDEMFRLLSWWKWSKEIKYVVKCEGNFTQNSVTAQLPLSLSILSTGSYQNW